MIFMVTGAQRRAFDWKAAVFVLCEPVSKRHCRFTERTKTRAEAAAPCPRTNPFRANLATAQSPPFPLTEQPAGVNSTGGLSQARPFICI